MPRTRQQRIQDPAAIGKALGSAIGKIIHVVLDDDRVIIGRVETVGQSKLTISNMRLKSMTFEFKQINEVYLDRLD